MRLAKLTTASPCFSDDALGSADGLQASGKKLLLGGERDDPSQAGIV
jgi:hypothetical protein